MTWIASEFALGARKFAVALAALLCVLTPARATEPPTLTERLAAVLNAQPRHSTDADEPPDTRAQRLLDVASAVSSGTQHAACRGAWKDVDTCRPYWRGDLRDLSAAVVAVGLHESHFARYVASGACNGPGGAHCDRDHKTGLPRARTYFQLWHSAAPDVWATEPGSDAELRQAAFATARLLAGFYAFCHTQTSGDLWTAAIAQYAGRGCREWPGAVLRRATMVRVRAAIDRPPPPPAQPWPAEAKLPAN